MSFIFRYVKFNSLEHRKGEDHFSMDKALFFAYLYENFEDKFLEVKLNILSSNLNANESHLSPGVPPSR